MVILSLCLFFFSSFCDIYPHLSTKTLQELLKSFGLSPYIVVSQPTPAGHQKYLNGDFLICAHITRVSPSAEF